MKIYSLSVRNRTSGLLLAAVVIGVGAALLFVGLALLATLAVAGVVVGSGIALYSRLRGRGSDTIAGAHRPVAALDPALEVFPRHVATEVPSLPDTRDDRQ